MDGLFVPLSKKAILTLDSTATISGLSIPLKIEGLTVLDGKTIAVANDNDFGVGSFALDLAAPSCTLVDSGLESRILTLRLNEPLKKK